MSRIDSTGETAIRSVLSVNTQRLHDFIASKHVMSAVKCLFHSHHLMDGFPRKKLFRLLFGFCSNNQEMHSSRMRTVPLRWTVSREGGVRVPGPGRGVWSWGVSGPGGVHPWSGG